MEECKVKKKSLKKAAVLAIAGAMAVTSLAACGAPAAERIAKEEVLIPSQWHGGAIR